ncbi:MAG: hypothetical protein WKF75_02895, partial [Singulisphaera sp.]
MGFRREGNVYGLAEGGRAIGKVGSCRLWREIADGSRGRPPASLRPEAGQPVAPDRSRPAVGRRRPGDQKARPATAPAKKPGTTAEFAAERRAVRLVSELRTQADALQKQREVLLAEGEARDALDVINRINSKSHKARLGSNPRLEQVLRNLEDMERAVQTVEIPPTLHDVSPKEDDRRDEEPASLVVDEIAVPPRAAHDISKLPRYRVLQIRDGNSITVRKPGEGPVLVRLLLGVAPLPPPTDSASSRGKKLDELIRNQEVALADDPERSPNGGRMAAWVYRVSDGLLVNLA